MSQEQLSLEQQNIGAYLCNRDLVGEIDLRHFTDPVAFEIARAMQELYAKGEPTDFITVCDKLAADKLAGVLSDDYTDFQFVVYMSQAIATCAPPPTDPQQQVRLYHIVKFSADGFQMALDEFMDGLSAFAEAHIDHISHAVSAGSAFERMYSVVISYTVTTK